MQLTIYLTILVNFRRLYMKHKGVFLTFTFQNL
jgi:hypothetical protein